MKICSKCKVTKDLSEFKFRDKKKDIYRTECRECGRKKHKEWRDKNPGVNRKYYDIQYEKTRFQYCKYCGERYRLVSSGGFCSKKCYLLGKIDKLQNGCWEWQGQLNVSGYGKASIYDVCISAHRLSYMEFKGEITESLYVCHTCDNRKCINPEHLFLGSAEENTHDMIKKGRAHWLKKEEIR